jgi:hypothetical protein
LSPVAGSLYPMVIHHGFNLVEAVQFIAPLGGQLMNKNLLAP